jgi:uncharacterized membrane protein
MPSMCNKRSAKRKFRIIKNAPFSWIRKNLSRRLTNGVVIVALDIFAKYMEFRQGKKQVRPHKRQKVGYQLRKKLNIPSN